MIRGFVTLVVLLVGGLVTLAVASALLLPVIGLLTVVIVAVVKLAFFLALLYFIVRLVSPETADRAYDSIRSKLDRVA